MSNYILESKRYKLREFKFEDAPHLFRLNDHPDVLKYTTDPPFKSLDEVYKFIEQYDAYNQFGFGRWTIECKQSGKFIGWCGLKYIIAENEVDIGYRLLPEHWGKGIAVETGIACCEFGLTQFGIKRIVARVHTMNKRSIRVAEKMNMTFEKEIYYNDVPWLNYIYSSETRINNHVHFINFPYLK